MGTTLIDFPQLVDLALGTPESGAVNFNILHALLHGIVQMLSAEHVRVELIGTPETPSCGVGPKQMFVEEYDLEQAGQESTKTLIEKPLVDVSKIIVVRKSVKDDTSSSTKAPDKMPEKTPQSKHEDIAISKESSAIPGPTTEHETSVKEKRVMSREIKLEDTERIKNMESTEKRITELEKSLKELKNLCKNCSHVEILLGKVDVLEKKIHQMATSSKTVEDITQPSKTENNKINESKGSTMNDNNNLIDGRRDTPSAQQLMAPNDFKIIHEEMRLLKNEIDQIKIKVHEISKLEYTVEKQTQPPLQVGSNVNKGKSKTGGVSAKSKDDVAHCIELSETLNHKFEVLNSKFLTMTDRLLDIEKELCELLENSQAPSKDEETHTAQISITDLHNELLNIKAIIADSTAHCDFLLSERKIMLTDIQNLRKAVTEIRNTKVDKEDIDELLAEKADYNMLQRKVSVDYFDASKRDLESVMIETITKMQERESEWCKTIADLKRQLEAKLNAAEITAVKEYLERRLQMLSDKMKVFCSGRKDPDAAGTHIKLLKNLNCISCNQHVFMRTEELQKVPKISALPAQKSIKPFLTYELDNLRKQMKDIPNSRNMHHFETMFKDKGLIMDEKARKICNRYCGGSHTVITAQDRIGRGRCGKIFGVRKTTAKCICAEPEPPPCTCPEEPQEAECVCPTEPEVCSCSSESDPFEKCMTAKEKRCLDIDQNRREKYKAETDWRPVKCKEGMSEGEEHGKRLEESKEKDKCKMDLSRREKCLQELQLRDRCEVIDRYPKYKQELNKYKHCKELGQRDRRGSQTDRYPVGQSSCFEPNDSRAKRRDSSRANIEHHSSRCTSANNLTKTESVRSKEPKVEVPLEPLDSIQKEDITETPHAHQEEKEIQHEHQADMPEMEDQKSNLSHNVPEEISADKPVEQNANEANEDKAAKQIVEAPEQNV